MEIHDNGTAVHARAIRPIRDAPSKTHLHIMDVQHFVANSIWLAQIVAENLNANSPYDVLIRMESEQAEPIYIRGYDHYGHLIDVEQLAPIRKFIPVAVTLEPMGDSQELLNRIREIATDVVNQGGVTDIGNGYIKTA